MKPFVNLLPLSYRRRQLVRRSLIRWSLVWAICIAASAAACGFTWHRSQAIQQAALAAERSVGPLERLVQEESMMQASLKDFDAKGTIMGQVRCDRPPLSLLGAVSQSAHRCEGRLVVHHLTFERKDRQPTEGNKPPQPDEPQKPMPEKQEPWGCVTLRGDAVDNVAVATFVVELRESGLFRKVELKSCLRSPTRGRETRTYLLECEI